MQMKTVYVRDVDVDKADERLVGVIDGLPYADLDSDWETVECSAWCGNGLDDDNEDDVASGVCAKCRAAEKQAGTEKKEVPRDCPACGSVAGAGQDERGVCLDCQRHGR